MFSKQLIRVYFWTFCTIININWEIKILGKRVKTAETLVSSAVNLHFLALYMPCTVLTIEAKLMCFFIRKRNDMSSVDRISFFLFIIIFLQKRSNKWNFYIMNRISKLKWNLSKRVFITHLFLLFCMSNTPLLLTNLKFMKMPFIIVFYVKCFLYVKYENVMNTFS